MRSNRSSFLHLRKRRKSNKSTWNSAAMYTWLRSTHVNFYFWSHDLKKLKSSPTEKSENLNSVFTNFLIPRGSRKPFLTFAVVKKDPARHLYQPPFNQPHLFFGVSLSGHRTCVQIAQTSRVCAGRSQGTAAGRSKGTVARRP